MIVPLDLPAGCHKNGTEYQSKGRWRDVNLVRWREGAMMPVGGWDAFAGGFSAATLGASPPAAAYGAIAWVTNAGTKYLAWGTYRDAFVMSSTGTITDITPAGFSAVSADTSTWSWGVFGQIPVGCGRGDGRLWEWDLNVANNLTAITNAPTSCRALCVTPERFIFALGDGGDPRSIRWCDREDRTVWTPAATNQAGGWDLDTEGEIMFALPMRGETLIVTTKDAWVARYVGYPDVYAFTRVGSCSAVGHLCGAQAHDTAYWMGERAFYMYSSGYVTTLPCEVSDYVFANMFSASVNLKWGFTAWHNSEYNEIWWHYRTAAAQADLIAADACVIYNYQERHWSLGAAPFTCVVDRVPFDKPLGFTAGSSFLDEGSSLSDDPGFTLGTNWRVAGGVLDQSAPAASTASLPVVVLNGGDYIIEVGIANRTVGTLTVRFGTSTTTAANGTQYFLLTANSNPELLEFIGDGTWDGDITYFWIYRPVVMQLETGVVHETALEEYAKTGPLEIGDGERRVHVTQVIPDQQDASELTLTFAHREYPGATETTEAAVTAAAPTDVRFSGRQFTMKVAPSAAADWRSGVHRLDITHGGKR